MVVVDSKFDCHVNDKCGKVALSRQASFDVVFTDYCITTSEMQILLVTFAHAPWYDCGLFVIKFMQGFNYPSGVYRMDDTKRPRLLMELCGDENNRDALEVMKKFEAWKAERGTTVYLDSDSQREWGIPNLSALCTTGQGRRRGGQSTSARGRGRGSGRVGPIGRGGALARGAAN
ncbi:hypothetical protein RHMOL_Rhmol01G0184400 [Rhododendron molle]|uniref:Uncharacterized protein n=1 Tax=Rhododendron molle TaxID=49168 RepID=A0ACC0Q356_RHOML|nr:hypothetical protein RHMOL_Rhmol01G0184400 [Rhododendron molle]